MCPAAISNTCRLRTPPRQSPPTPYSLCPHPTVFWYTLLSPAISLAVPSWHYPCRPCGAPGWFGTLIQARYIELSLVEIWGGNECSIVLYPLFSQSFRFLGPLHLHFSPPVRNSSQYLVPLLPRGGSHSTKSCFGGGTTMAICPQTRGRLVPSFERIIKASIIKEIEWYASFSDSPGIQLRNFPRQPF